MEHLSFMMSYLLAFGSVIGGHLFGRHNIHLAPTAFLGKLLIRAFSAVVITAGSAYVGYAVRYAEEDVARQAFTIVLACIVGYAIMAVVSYEMRRKKPTHRPRF